MSNAYQKICCQTAIDLYNQGHYKESEEWINTLTISSSKVGFDLTSLKVSLYIKEGFLYQLYLTLSSIDDLDELFLMGGYLLKNRLHDVYITLLNHRIRMIEDSYHLSRVYLELAHSYGYCKNRDFALIYIEKAYVENRSADIVFGSIDILRDLESPLYLHRYLIRLDPTSWDRAYLSRYFLHFGICLYRLDKYTKALSILKRVDKYVLDSNSTLSLDLYLILLHIHLDSIELALDIIEEYDDVSILIQIRELLLKENALILYTVLLSRVKPLFSGLSETLLEIEEYRANYRNRSKEDLKYMIQCIGSVSLFFTDYVYCQYIVQFLIEIETLSQALLFLKQFNPISKHERDWRNYTLSLLLYRDHRFEDAWDWISTIAIEECVHRNDAMLLKLRIGNRLDRLTEIYDNELDAMILEGMQSALPNETEIVASFVKYLEEKKLDSNHSETFWMNLAYLYSFLEDGDAIMRCIHSSINLSNVDFNILGRSISILCDKELFVQALNLLLQFKEQLSINCSDYYYYLSLCYFRLNQRSEALFYASNLDIVNYRILTLFIDLVDSNLEYSPLMKKLYCIDDLQFLLRYMSCVTMNKKRSQILYGLLKNYRAMDLESNIRLYFYRLLLCKGRKRWYQRFYCFSKLKEYCIESGMDSLIGEIACTFTSKGYYSYALELFNILKDNALDNEVVIAKLNCYLNVYNYSKIRSIKDTFNNLMIPSKRGIDCYILGLFQYRIGNLDSALSLFLEAHEKHINGNNIVKIGELLFRLRRYEEAEQFMKGKQCLLKTITSLIEFKVLLARVLNKEGKYYWAGSLWLHILKNKRCVSHWMEEASGVLSQLIYSLDIKQESDRRYLLELFRKIEQPELLSCIYFKMRNRRYLDLFFWGIKRIKKRCIDSFNFEIGTLFLREKKWSRGIRYLDRVLTFSKDYLLIEKIADFFLYSLNCYSFPIGVYTRLLNENMIDRFSLYNKMALGYIHMQKWGDANFVLSKVFYDSRAINNKQYMKSAYLLAQVMFFQGHYDRAMYFLSICKDHVSYEDKGLLIAECHYKLKRYYETIRLCNLYVDEANRNSSWKYHLLLAKSYLRVDETNLSIGFFLKVLNENGEKIITEQKDSIYIELFYIYFHWAYDNEINNLNIEQAIQGMLKAEMYLNRVELKNITEERALLYENAYLLYDKKRCYEKAFYYGELLSLLNYNGVHSLLLKGSIFDKIGQWDMAESFYLKSIALNKDLELSYSLLIEFCERVNRREKLSYYKDCLCQVKLDTKECVSSNKINKSIYRIKELDGQIELFEKSLK